MATAKHRAIDTFRRSERLTRKTAELGRELEQQEAEGPDWAAALDEVVEDDLLRLVFIACHPVLSREARVALTLRLLGGLTTDEIARAFLVAESTVAQRIVRAKRTLAAARVPFELPAGAEFTGRLSSVLEVVYLVFNEGYAATAGEHWTRPALCQDALRLGRILAELTPGESEVHGLVALMEIQASRLPARVGPAGEPVLLTDQDRGRWDRVLIHRGLAALDRAERTGAPLGPYALQAAIAACHARAGSVETTDWARIAALYEALAELSPSPVVELNRAVAVSRAYGPAAGLELVDALVDVPALRGYHLLPSVRGDLLVQLGRDAEARAEFERAAAMTRNERERALLLDRAAACGPPDVRQLRT
jgi:predicted RNA polymerase sigma factor